LCTGPILAVCTIHILQSQTMLIIGEFIIYLAYMF
jgi:hypothetical protein